MVRADRILVVAIATLLLPTLARAMFIPPTQVPIERLLKNTAAYVKEHPTDAMGPYTLGRIHYLAFVLQGRELPATDDGAAARLPAIGDGSGGQVWAPHLARQEGAQSATERATHLNAAVAQFNCALAMNTKEPLFHLGLASISEAALASGIKVNDLDNWREQAIYHYRLAFEAAAARDEKIDHQPIAGLSSLMSYEAGTHVLELIRARGARSDESSFIANVEKKLRALDNKPRGPVTPIVFSLERRTTLAALIDDDVPVRFDLDGTGWPQLYPWPRPDTAILVWAPRGGGVVDGHQLFGNVALHMIWSDGYRALDALDDDRDGILSGDELAGLAVWRDANHDGASNANEIVAINVAGVRALHFRGARAHGESLVIDEGLVRADGEVLPTYDWVASPVSGSSDAPATFAQR